MPDMVLARIHSCLARNLGDTLTGDPATIRGSRGNNYFYGEDDVPRTVSGLRGDDTILAFNGTLYGGQDDDSLQAGFGISLLIGGAGDDILLGGYRGDVLFGNQGDDIFRDTYGANRMDGGIGSDTFLGLGDRSLFSATDTVTGGAGSDVFSLSRDAAQGETVIDIVTDFDAKGANADVIDFNAILPFSAEFAGKNGFEVGLVRLKRSGEDTLLQLGNGSGERFWTVLVLQAVKPGELTAANFISDGRISLDPDFARPGGARWDARSDAAAEFGAEDLFGGQGDDALTGQSASNLFFGGAGGDVL